MLVVISNDLPVFQLMSYRCLISMIEQHKVELGINAALLFAPTP